MTTTTIPRVTVELGGATAQALWAAMHEDDDLAHCYADLCVIHGLKHITKDVSSRYWTTAELVKLHANLGQAVAEALAREGDVVQRWLAYSEPPF